MNKDIRKIIGVVGGIGPYAGLDLVQKIFDQTQATCDQDHLPVSMWSVPNSIAARTQFLSGKSKVNPAFAISEVISMLAKQGASVIGIPCNTAHAAPIFTEIINQKPPEVKLLHMINEVAAYIKEHIPSAVKVGILSTAGTLGSNVYPHCLAQVDLVGIQVSEAVQERYISPAIYSPDHGIKACSNPATAEAKNGLHIGVEYLLEKGVDAIILGCTEIPLALTENEVKGIPLIDATKVLARALIMEYSPDALLD